MTTTTIIIMAGAHSRRTILFSNLVLNSIVHNFFLLFSFVFSEALMKDDPFSLDVSSKLLETYSFFEDASLTWLKMYLENRSSCLFMEICEFATKMLDNFPFNCVNSSSKQNC